MAQAAPPAVDGEVRDHLDRELESEPKETTEPAASVREGVVTNTSMPWLAIAVIVGLLAFPKLPFVPFSLVGVAVQAGQFVIVTASIVMLTGWVGQISLGHAALVGIGGYATGWAVGSLGLAFPFNTLVAGLAAGAMAAVLGGVALRVRGLYLAVATLIFSWMADAFLFRLDSVTRHSFIEVAVAGDPNGVPRFDLTDRATMFYVTWGVALAVIFLVTNLRDSKTGRAFFALRGSEVGAASLGVNVTRYKLLAFTFSGFLTGIAGNLLMLDSRSLSPESFSFTVSLFYLAVAVVGGLTSLGGAVASSVLFASLNEVFFRVRFLGDALDLVSALLLAVVLLLYRGGLASIPGSVRNLVERLREGVENHEPERLREAREAVPRAVGQSFRRSGTAVVKSARYLAWPITAVGRLVGRNPSGDDAFGSGPDGGQGPTGRMRRPALLDADGNPVELDANGMPRAAVEAELTDEIDDPDDEETPSSNGSGHLASAGLRVALPPEREDREAFLEARGITVRFGGLTAVNDASLVVREHEIVGLIGPNGAGKTTLFNAIAGLNQPTEGNVHLFGRDATRLPVHLRAQLGVARTFQAIQLFPQLTVFENLLVATHLHNQTRFFDHIFAVDSSVLAERAMRERVTAVVERLRLEDIVHRPVADLPFGVLRMVEVARAMVTGFPLIMLDEPASGLDNSETDRLAEMLLEIRAQGATLLLIEHDVRMVTGVSDYMYVLNRGEIIADGPPTDVQRDPAVVAAYLGEPTDGGQEKTRSAKEQRHKKRSTAKEPVR